MLVTLASQSFVCLSVASLLPCEWTEYSRYSHPWVTYIIHTHHSYSIDRLQTSHPIKRGIEGEVKLHRCRRSRFSHSDQSSCYVLTKWDWILYFKRTVSICSRLYPSVRSIFRYTMWSCHLYRQSIVATHKMGLTEWVAFSNLLSRFSEVTTALLDIWSYFGS